MDSGGYRTSGKWGCALESRTPPLLVFVKQNITAPRPSVLLKNTEEGEGGGGGGGGRREGRP